MITNFVFFELLICYAFALGSYAAEGTKAKFYAERPGVTSRKLLDSSSGGGNPRKCEPSDLYEFEREDNVACKDDNIEIFRDVSRKTCEEQCSCRDWCVAYTYNSKNDDCYLKETCYDKEDVRSDESGFKRPRGDVRRDLDIGERGGSEKQSSEKEPSSDKSEDSTDTNGQEAELCPPMNSAPAFRREENNACKDENAMIFREVSLQVCEEQCACRSWCTAYTYNSEREDCYLKETCNLQDWHPIDMSGFKVSSPPSTTYKVVQNGRCTGAQPILEGPSSSIEACRQRCTGNSMCAAFEISFQTGVCRLLPSCGNLDFSMGFYTEVKEGFRQPEPYPPFSPPYVPPYEPPPYSPTTNPLPPIKEPGCDPDSGLPFGLGNCVCEGQSNGEPVAETVCAELKAECRVLTPFSASQSRLLEQVQTICDSLAKDQCVTAAQQAILSRPDCSNVVFNGGGDCSRERSLAFVQTRVEELCNPICPNCRRT
uniref:Apple domain-containing protein n=1 Tax=Tetraselmis sp. GSL018 TaxID=582737 RepID=A0A061SA98_9CHLO|mmetsp:Transcript_6038/g.14623  ORF Transcript_6038/g.14623 Transcript_6038/m.14623 type:complete len:484 (-) Transcript_6038:305-1756(-)|eukprot:CAMPEP_0177596838 /NCGR_PEP_ID=MMETSP0419_2-20121207/11356_1 /TAXON_ID=582737 /ORGANISM="Tetraselmis sp., Strain GSL018" /LENGTH=483 /DNA_ID=CAMNT_0019088897 /DNA_START=72 /DNA_END=1523 /DNA_ORIENTATION=-